jgi:hypothetical protein
MDLVGTTMAARGCARLHGQRPLVRPACRNPQLPASGTDEPHRGHRSIGQPASPERRRAAPSPGERLCAVLTKDKWDNA